MIRTSTSALLLLALVLGTACNKKKAKAVPEDAAPYDARPVTMTAAPDMKTHFSFLPAARDALLFADLEGARQSLAEVVKDQGPHSEEVRKLAASVNEASTSEELATTMAKLANACASCHHKLDTIPTQKLEKPPRMPGFRDHMAGHRWSLNQMWLGLALPSDAHWQAGTTFLAKAPTHLRSLSDYGDDADAAMDLATQTHRLADEGMTTLETNDRVDLFAGFLAACVGCHALPASAPRLPPLSER